MRMKLIVAMVNDQKTDTVVEAARKGGATGVTIITNVRGEGLEPEKTFMGLFVSASCDVILFLVAETRARKILELISDAGSFDEEEGMGVAFQLHIEDVVGIGSQLPVISREVENEI